MGIDPGTVTSGYGIVDEEGHRIFYVDSGAINTTSKLSFPDRLKKIYDGLEIVISQRRPDAVVLESIFFAKNAQSALKLGHARGVAVLAAVKLGVPVFEYTPLEIKQSVVGYGLAEKGQVQQMVKTLLKLEVVPKPHDASDALAAAICHIHSSRMREAAKGAGIRPGTGVKRQK